MGRRVNNFLRSRAVWCCLSLMGEPHRWRSRRSSRRLINLIFVGRNHMLIIRRELPRTSCAGLVITATYCIKQMRVLRFAAPSTATSAALLFLPVVLCGRSLSSRHLSFDSYADGPDEAQQLAADGGHDLLLVLSAGQEFLVSHVESVLRFPGDLSHLGTDSLLSFQNLSAQPWSVLIGPGRLHEQGRGAGGRDLWERAGRE
jgi:hypothetical protein